MPFPLIAAALGGAGLLKGMDQHRREKQIEDSDRALAAATARYSPWTGMTPGPIRHAGSAFGSMLGSALQGGAAGMMFGGGGGAAGGGAEQAVGSSPDIWGQMAKQNNPGAGADYLGEMDKQQALSGAKPNLYSASRYNSGWNV